MRYLYGKKIILSMFLLFFCIGLLSFTTACGGNGKVKYNEDNRKNPDNTQLNLQPTPSPQPGKPQAEQENSSNTPENSMNDTSQKGDEKNSVPKEPGFDNTAAPSSKTVYLTFDDGPSSNTEEILDVLKKYKVKATFFVIGNTTPTGENAYKRIVNEGHAIGNHTFGHKYNITYRSIDAYIAETKKLDTLLMKTTGIKPKIMRFPGGSNNTVNNKYSKNFSMEELAARMENEGYRYFDWNVSSRDMATPTPNASMILQFVTDGVMKNQQPSIVLMHDTTRNTSTLEALPKIIEMLQGKAYKFGVLSKSSYCYQFKLYNARPQQ